MSGKTETPLKTSDSLENLCIYKTNIDGTPEATLEQVPYLWYPVWFQKDEHQFLIDTTKNFAQLEENVQYNKPCCRTKASYQEDRDWSLKG